MLPGGSKARNFEKFKYSQELSSKFWVAGVAVISLTLLGIYGYPEGSSVRLRDYS